MIFKHNHTHLTSTEPEAMVEFFRKVLGATVIQERVLAGGPAWDLDVGGLVVRVSRNTTADGALREPILGWHHIALQVDNMEGAIADLKSKGVEFLVEPSGSSGAAFIKRGNVLIELVRGR